MTSIADAFRRGRMDFTSAILFREYFSHVEITNEPAEVFAGNIMIPARIVVSAVWKSVDRPNVGGWSCGSNMKLALRLKAAVESGAAFCLVAVKKDTNGQSYVSASDLILGRTMNADLKRLGY